MLQWACDVIDRHVYDGEQFSKAVLAWANEITGFAPYNHLVDEGEVFCTNCGHIEIQPLRAMVSPIAYECSVCEGYDPRYCAEPLDPDYERRLVMGQEENSETHWEMAQDAYEREHEGEWDNYVPGEDHAYD
ncbi:MAG TPA: hypothetical protein VH593_06795, partial [Ktedonobacteraceae bacterium]